MHELTGLVYGPDHHFHPGRVTVRDGLIGSIDLDDDIFDTAKETRRTGPRTFIIPGLIDIHFHGCMGMDFCDGTDSAIQTLAAWEASQGVTSICPATLTLPPEQLKDILAKGAAFASRQKERLLNGEKETQPVADLVGINMEGPFISRVKKGAQNEKHILPCSADLCRDFLEASGGLVKIIGLAPEENPDFEIFIREMKDRVRISLAHTNADYETAMKAFGAGACHAVHLFNAMPEMTHRSPGVVGAVRDCPWVRAELICDGNHVHPAVVRAAFDMLGEERIVLISDSLSAAGMGDGEIMLGGKKVSVKGSRAVLAEEGNLAGSVTSLSGCLRTVVTSMGIPLEKAVRCAAENPAEAIGLGEFIGKLLPGRRADLVVLNEDLNVTMVMKDGIAYNV